MLGLLAIGGISFICSVVAITRPENNSDFPVDFIIHGINFTRSQQQWTQSMNYSLCQELTQFMIEGSNKIVSVCLYQNKTRVDIRHFYGGIASIKGLWMSVGEWRGFTKLLFDIARVMTYQEIGVNGFRTKRKLEILSSISIGRNATSG